jgi:hypothetical protein
MNQHAVNLLNPFNIDISNGYLDVNQTGDRYFIIGEMPSNIASRFSKSIMIRFKALASGDAVNFLFTTNTSFASRKARNYVTAYKWKY